MAIYPQDDLTRFGFREGVPTRWANLRISVGPSRGKGFLFHALEARRPSGRKRVRRAEDDARGAVSQPRRCSKKRTQSRRLTEPIVAIWTQRRSLKYSLHPPI